jgi:predicted GTPase
VSPLAGTTHDPIDSELICFGRRLTLIDTAGIRRRAQGQLYDSIEMLFGVVVVV